jgi:uncharacterized glyoxalase superfamily protein PhnB
MAVTKLTAVLLADRIEPCVEFWTGKLGFQKTIDVPGPDGLVFASLQKDTIELMYQTYASVENDDHSHKGFAKGPTFLFVEVENLDETMKAVEGAEIVMPVRSTFYGSKEFGVKDPAGHIVTFAQMGAPA